jgi:hypothetical protein
VGLGLYIANSFKAMKSAARQLQADLALAGHPNAFPSKPVAIKSDWDRLQDMQGTVDADAEIVVEAFER